MSLLEGDVHNLTYEEMLKFCAEYLPQLKKANPNSLRVAALCKLYEDAKRMHEIINRLACYHDHHANQHLRVHESYSCFDEPSSVRIARNFLQEL